MRAADFAYFDAPGPIGLAHRGGAAYGPNVGFENSMAAFRRAVMMGYRYLETDVHATSDGEVVAVHDERLDRVTDGSGAIKELPYAVVRQASIGGREPIPRLVDLLEEFPETRFNIDVKAEGAVRPTAAIIRQLGAVDRVCVGSFSERRLHEVRRIVGPRLATAAGQVGTASVRYVPAVLSRVMTTPAPVLQVPERHVVAGRELRLVTPRVVQRIHAMGKHIHVWTVDARADMDRLLDWGVDGIVTDRIDTLAEVLAERGVPLGM